MMAQKLKLIMMILCINLPFFSEWSGIGSAELTQKSIISDFYNTVWLLHDYTGVIKYVKHIISGSDWFYDEKIITNLYAHDFYDDIAKTIDFSGTNFNHLKFRDKSTVT